MLPKVDPGILVRGRLFVPCLLASILVAVLSIYYWGMLDTGTIREHDEYLTLDRANAYLIQGDYFVVHMMNRPTFNKPPFQYWLTAGLLGRGYDILFSLRFPSYLFGILTLINAGFLAYLLYPRNAYVIPASIALLAGSTKFWDYSISAMLDTGAAFFATATVTAVLLALDQPRWWYGVALAVGLGALQKAPIGLPLVAMMLIVVIFIRIIGNNDPYWIFRNRHFWISICMMLAGVFWWPVVQWMKFGPDAFERIYVQQMIERFSPYGDNHLGFRTNYILDGETWLRVPAIAALLVLPWILRRLELLALTALLIAFVIVMSLATGFVLTRYSLVLLPLLAAALAVVVIRVLPGKVLPTVVIAALAFSAGGPLKSAEALRIVHSNQAQYLPLLQQISETLQEDESLLVCRGKGGRTGINIGAISYYASNGRPFFLIDTEDFGESFLDLEKDGKISPPYRGICAAGEFDRLACLLDGGETIAELNGYVYWRSTGVTLASGNC